MIRIGGAQIPVTDNIAENVKHIKEAINWASKNDVDMLLTPEGSLSGYMNTFDELNDSNLSEAIKEVTSHSSSKNMYLALGTEYIKNINYGKVKCSQIQYYSDTALLIDSYDKQMVIPGENNYPGKGLKVVDFQIFNHKGQTEFKIGSFICNDMWGQLDNKQIVTSDLFYYQNSNTNIIFHASNGFRGPEAGDEESNRKLKEFADIQLWMASRFNIPIVTVDNCYKLDGSFYDGPTSSTSGVIHNGEWLVKAAPAGTDYFYYDFNF
jgi:predicted amidohydrolase